MDEERMQFTTADIEAYLSRFHEQHREMVFRQIAEDSILRSFLESRDGRIVTNGLFDMIGKHLFRLYELCCDGFHKNHEAIRAKAAEIAAIHAHLLWMSNLLNKGSEHKQAVAKNKRG